MATSASAGIPACDPATFRHVVGHLASGVTLVTTRTAAGSFGMTASSVTSLSLSPPMMLACLNTTSTTCAAVVEAGAYAVNVLGQGQGHLAQQFATPSADKFTGVRVVEGALGLPVLADALARIECEVVEQVQAATHTVFLGRVLHAEAAPGSPLTYFRGGFGRFEFTRDDEVYQRARRQVLDRAYAPDAVLSLDDLAYTLDVDKPAAFYALTRLTADGLVRRDPDRGYVVVPFDTRTSDATFDARCAIELGVVDMVIGRVPADELAALRARFEAMAALLVGDRFVDFDGYLDANYAFHETLVALARSAPLTTAFAQLHIRSVMTRSFGATPVTSQRFIEAQRGITEGLERGDGAAARAAVHRYTELAKQRVRQILEQTGGRL
ncbi:flavin reductase [Geodermatophilus ruber]|uniref:NADH-FMN oxidoreductase RutF, flavin reductase (DIM6/NTAB) family n=1 Tax=Geodermatophilus ruber TaxID=504800 RepID=A0A1I4I707_9ACTN|nr:flavin reductase [Geodermatophilus ruber]SFL49867.1 NADH-FMN oxidoreductase RutF, flavin reductase (DIM6/NTAB) family [Geodermatophilus ruber]